MENNDNKQITETLERLKIYHELLMNSVWEKFKLLPQISALSATLLIVATFNERVLVLTPYVLILLIILLALIPVSLWGYMIELRKSERHARDKIFEISQIKMKPERSTAYLPEIIVAVISVIIFLIILAIIDHNFFHP